MRRLLLTLLVLSTGACPAQSSQTWKARLNREMPLLGHRNWILVVDSAYPLQTAPGVETIETNASQEEVVGAVLSTISKSIQVRPLIHLDAELPLVPDAEAPGASAYRNHLALLLKPYPVTYRPHEQMIKDIDDAGKNFHILVLKTNMVIPYTSVFLQLERATDGQNESDRRFTFGILPCDRLEILRTSEFCFLQHPPRIM